LTKHECLEILTKLVKHEHYSRIRVPVTIKFKNTRGSYASYSTHQLSISCKQLIDNGYWYGVALIVHEFSHVCASIEYGWKILPHGKEFKKVENRLLKLFGLSIKRKKAYAKIIYKDNKEVWHE